MVFIFSRALRAYLGVDESSIMTQKKSLYFFKEPTDHGQNSSARKFSIMTHQKKSSEWILRFEFSKNLEFDGA